ncbi:uncharacterized protein AKAME5_001635100 [Lates japonicus]|uniref:Uncharacterized protein n=1 Tax=Lates japonicus TaxID=270547 RepID=A0AAD3N3G1_LATJO|nr:uncharacterized protein AKAME5_001635100 [Lates japonicus]
MEKVPNCALIDQASLDMDEEMSSEELGELRCSDLDVPLFISETFEPVIDIFLKDIRDEQWMLLEARNIDSDMILLLSNMCHAIVEMASDLILEAVEPQVFTWVQRQTSLDGASSSTNTSILKDRNYHRVTEEDIQASFGDSLQQCFGASLGVEQERSLDSDKLLGLFSAAVKRRVNLELDLINGSVTKPEEPAAETQSCDSHTEDMVYHIAHILRRYVPHLESSYNQGCQGSNCSGCGCIDEAMVLEDFKEEDDITETVCSGGHCPDEIADIKDCREEEDMVEPGRAESYSPLKVIIIEDFDEEDETENLDAPAHERPERSQTDGTQRTSGGNSLVKKVWRCFRKRSSKVSPACEVKNHREVKELEKGSTPLPSRNQRCPAITTMLSSVARIFKKPFTSCSQRG